MEQNWGNFIESLSQSRISVKTINWNEYTAKKKHKKWFWKDFSSWWPMQFLEQLWKMWENMRYQASNDQRKN